MTYSVKKNGQGQDVVVLEREDGSTLWIPMVEENSDYQAYLRWLNPDNNGGLN